MEKPPNKKSSGDISRELARAAVSIVPVAGGPLQVLLENVFQAPLDERKQKWMESLADLVTELESKVKELTPEALSKHPAFISVALQATQIAYRSHQDEKLTALRNAVFNSALPGAPDDDLKSIFLRLIEEFTPWHLRLLGLLDNPTGWMDKNGKKNPGWTMGGVSAVVNLCFPELNGKREFVAQLVRDLQTAGLVTQGGFMNTTMTASSMLGSHTTDHGKAFIRFVTKGT